MNPYEPLKNPEHIVGFSKQDAPSPETLRKAGFKAIDVICWTNQKGLIVFQNGEEYYKVPKKSEIDLAVEDLAVRLGLTPEQVLAELEGRC